MKNNKLIILTAALLLGSVVSCDKPSSSQQSSGSGDTPSAEKSHYDESKSIIERLNIIKKHDLPFEYIWLDAGWYGKDSIVSNNEFESDWWAHVGDWTVNTAIHPNGLKDVSETIHDNNKKFLLWFETERARLRSPIAKEHPEYFIANPGEDVHLLLNLGDPIAFDYCFNQLSSIIEELKIDCYRQDFNIDPLIH